MTTIAVAYTEGKDEKGEYVIFLGQRYYHEAAIKAAVAAEREVWANAVAQGLPPDVARAVDKAIRARGAAHD